MAPLPRLRQNRRIRRGPEEGRALAGECWQVVESVAEPVLLQAGDCFLLPRGLPFRLATDLSLEPVLYTVASTRLGMRSEAPGVTEGTR